MMGEYRDSMMPAGLRTRADSLFGFRRGDRSMLASFQGRPQELSPKARYHMMMGKFFPNTYGCARLSLVDRCERRLILSPTLYSCLKPFDRHDWVIHRPAPSSSSAGYTAASPTQAYTTHRCE